MHLMRVWVEDRGRIRLTMADPIGPGTSSLKEAIPDNGSRPQKGRDAVVTQKANSYLHRSGKTRTPSLTTPQLSEGLFIPSSPHKAF